MATGEKRANATSEQISQIGPSRGQTTNSGSLASVLKQGLSSGDGHLIESVLRCQDEEVVKATVRELSGILAAQLLGTIVTRIHNSPLSTGRHIVWIRYVLRDHIGFFLTVPAGRESMQALRQIAEEMISNELALTRLQGMVDGLLHRAERNSDLNSLVSKMTSDAQGPLVVHVEGEADEVDVDEVLRFRIEDDNIGSQSDSSDGSPAALEKLKRNRRFEKQQRAIESRKGAKRRLPPRIDLTPPDDDEREDGLKFKRRMGSEGNDENDPDLLVGLGNSSVDIDDLEDDESEVEENSAFDEE